MASLICGVCSTTQMNVETETASQAKRADCDCQAGGGWGGAGVSEGPGKAGEEPSTRGQGGAGGETSSVLRRRSPTLAYGRHSQGACKKVRAWVRAGS